MKYVMNRISYFLSLVSVLALGSCTEKIDKHVNWPEWPSRPVIENAKISAGGSNSITAGDNVNFTARIQDKYCPLESYTLEIRYGDNLVYETSAEIAGNEASVSLDFAMPFAAYLPEEDFYPEVSISALNAKGGKMTIRLSKENSLSVARPNNPEKLYVTDNESHVYVLEKTSEPMLYRSADTDRLKTLGTSFFISTGLENGKPSGYIWGQKDNTISVNANDMIKTPDTGGYGFKSLGFNIYSFTIDKVVNLQVTIDKNDMAVFDQGGIQYLSKENVTLVRDCEVIFNGFSDLSSILQPDRFVITGDNTAKFTGNTQQWSFWYDTTDSWMILNYAINNTSGQIWVTGDRACFPLGNDDTGNQLNYLKGDGKDRYATLAAVKDDEGHFRIMLYLKADFIVQFYRWIKWSSIVSLTSSDDTLGAIAEDGVTIRPGSAFQPGRYMIDIHLTDQGNADGDGAKADILLTKM